MQEQILHARSSCTHQRIVHAAIQFYRAIGYRKTTVADIARETAMSPANVYRFFASRRALEEAVVAELFEEVFAAAAQAARSGGSALQRLAATLRTISQLHEHRLARDSQLHELMAAAVRENWPVARSYADRIRDLVRPIIAAGQASGEVRLVSPVSLTCCLLEAMDGHLNPSRINTSTVRLAFDEMMDFCAGALHHVPRGRSIDLIADQSCSVRIASGICG